MALETVDSRLLDVVERIEKFDAIRTAGSASQELEFVSALDALSAQDILDVHLRCLFDLRRSLVATAGGELARLLKPGPGVPQSTARLYAERSEIGVAISSALVTLAQAQADYELEANRWFDAQLRPQIRLQVDRATRQKQQFESLMKTKDIADQQVKTSLHEVRHGANFAWLRTNRDLVEKILTELA